MTAMHKQPMLLIDRIETADFDQQMQARLDAIVGDVKTPPSEQIEAWRAYERATINALGHNPAPNAMAYNLYAECVKHLRTVNGLMDTITDKHLRRLYGRPPRQVPRHAIGVLAYAVGFRYLRGLDSITCRLSTHMRDEFTRERDAFLGSFKAAADAAHLLNDAGQCPQAVENVIQMFRLELQKLAAWLECIGDRSAAAWLESQLR